MGKPLPLPPPPLGTTHYSNRDEIRRDPRCKISNHTLSAGGGNIGLEKLKIVHIFGKAYPFHSFYEIFIIYRQIFLGLITKIWGFTQEVPELWWLKVGDIFPQIFSAPSGQTVHRTVNFLEQE